MLYGASTIGKAGCELVAIYNVLRLKNVKVSFADIIYTADSKGYHMETGYFGTNPYKLGKILTKYKIKYSVIRNEKKLKMKRGTMYIVSYWNEGGASKGVHTVAVRVIGKNGLSVYNGNNANSFCNLLSKRGFIIGYKVK